MAAALEPGTLVEECTLRRDGHSLLWQVLQGEGTNLSQSMGSQEGHSVADRSSSATRTQVS